MRFEFGGGYSTGSFGDKFALQRKKMTTTFTWRQLRLANFSMQATENNTTLRPKRLQILITIAVGASSAADGTWDISVFQLIRKLTLSVCSWTENLCLNFVKTFDSYIEQNRFPSHFLAELSYQFHNSRQSLCDDSLEKFLTKWYLSVQILVDDILCKGFQEEEKRFHTSD